MARINVNYSKEICTCHMNCGCCSQSMSEYEIFELYNQGLINDLINVKKQKEALELRERELKNILLNRMNEHRISRISTESFDIRKVEDCNFERINTAKLKKAYPKAYYACTDSGYRQSYLTVSVK
ncbi:MAG: hypothetical protein ACERKZ_02330 [Lachnotalea sp.]